MATKRGQQRSWFYQPGQKLRYRPGYAQKNKHESVLVVKIQTHDGIQFEGKRGNFSPDYFEQV